MLFTNKDKHFHFLPLCYIQIILVFSTNVHQHHKYVQTFQSMSEFNQTLNLTVIYQVRKCK